MWVARCSVRVGVINHEPSPLRHLTEVAVRVVEILHGGEVGLGAQHHRELEAGLVAEDAGQDGDVATLIEHLTVIIINIIIIMTVCCSCCEA